MPVRHHLARAGIAESEEWLSLHLQDNTRVCNIRINKADELAYPALRVLHSQAGKLHRCVANLLSGSGLCKPSPGLVSCTVVLPSCTGHIFFFHAQEIHNHRVGWRRSNSSMALTGT